MTPVPEHVCKAADQIIELIERATTEHQGHLGLMDSWRRAVRPVIRAGITEHLRVADAEHMTEQGEIIAERDRLRVENDELHRALADARHESTTVQARGFTNDPDRRAEVIRGGAATIGDRLRTGDLRGTVENRVKIDGHPDHPGYLRGFPQSQVDVWFVHYSDFSGFVVFPADRELEALRHAVEHSMSVQLVRCGESVREQIERSR